jgi:hypothetical protein
MTEPGDNENIQVIFEANLVKAEEAFARYESGTRPAKAVLLVFATTIVATLLMSLFEHESRNTWLFFIYGAMLFILFVKLPIWRKRLKDLEIATNRLRSIEFDPCNTHQISVILELVQTIESIHKKANYTSPFSDEFLAMLDSSKL